MFENVFDNILVIAIMLGLFLLAYMRFTNKTLIDVFKEIKDMTTPEEYE